MKHSHHQPTHLNPSHHVGHHRAHKPAGPGHAPGHHADHADMVADFRRRFWISLALTIPVLALSSHIRHLLGVGEVWSFPGDRFAEFGLSSIIFFYGGWPFLKGIRGELGKRQPGMMTLIGLAISVAYHYSSLVVFGLQGEVFFWELATLIDIMLLGHWIEMRSVLGASRALEELVKLMPSEAHRLKPGGNIEDVPLSELRRGDRVLVKPGEKIPTDGVIVEGRTTTNEAMLTGESKPVEKAEGDKAIGGSINGESAIVITVEKTGEETYLAQVIQLVRQAQESRSRSQDLANRAALLLTIIALSAGGITLAAWLTVGMDFNFALGRMVTVMVITCPHALGLAVPLVVAVSTALSATNGLLIRDRSAFERARLLRAVVFDKTGTLTEGRFGVTDIIPLASQNEDELLRTAAGLESQSEHPIAAGIVRTAKEKKLSFPTPRDFKAIPGKGAQATVDGKQIKVVSPGYLRENRIVVNDKRVEKAA
ncbi:MAG: heavy metal translocating P-type ATPase, partial [Candidatus Methylomirabilales bacterium]